MHVAPLCWFKDNNCNVSYLLIVLKIMQEKNFKEAFNEKTS